MPYLPLSFSLPILKSQFPTLILLDLTCFVMRTHEHLLQTAEDIEQNTCQSYQIENTIHLKEHLLFHDIVIG